MARRKAAAGDGPCLRESAQACLRAGRKFGMPASFGAPFPLTSMSGLPDMRHARSG
jgi:hypothetical protein